VKNELAHFRCAVFLLDRPCCPPPFNQRPQFAIERKDSVTFLRASRTGLGVACRFGAVPDWWDNPTMVVTLDAKRRLTVPAALAPAKPGDYFDARFDPEEDAIVFRRLGGQESWLTVMKDCPVSPDDVPPRRRAPAKRRKL